LGIEIYRFESIQTRLCWGTLRLEHRSPCAGVSDLLLNNCILIAVTIAALSPRYLRRFGPKMLIKFLAAFRFRSWFPSVNQRGTTHRIASHRCNFSLRERADFRVLHLSAVYVSCFIPFIYLVVFAQALKLDEIIAQAFGHIEIKQ